MKKLVLPIAIGVALLVGLLVGFFVGRATLEAKWSNPVGVVTPQDYQRSSGAKGADPTPPAGAKLVKALPLVRMRAEIAKLTAVDGGKTQGLDRGLDLVGLIDDGCPQQLRPVEILAHLADHVRIVEQPDHACVPVRVGRQGRVLLVPAQEAVGLDHIKGRDRGLEDEGQEGVRVEHHRRHQRVDLVGLEPVGRCRLVGRPLLGRRGRRIRFLSGQWCRQAQHCDDNAS